ncbi:hypothetical protein EVAR_92148_1 [Eumeta japonica]|uniref:Uncharacterized protein n=1 Tax=Eumeta variegata TaxID=151549 RepID=A0A4C1T1B4_EUMVA|nr:hypothetical protein EVAR_92148_1 [Eumeta japonica]
MIALREERFSNSDRIPDAAARDDLPLRALITYGLGVGPERFVVERQIRGSAVGCMLHVNACCRVLKMRVGGWGSMLALAALLAAAAAGALRPTVSSPRHLRPILQVPGVVVKLMAFKETKFRIINVGLSYFLVPTIIEHGHDFISQICIVL